MFELSPLRERLRCWRIVSRARECWLRSLVTAHRETCPPRQLESRLLLLWHSPVRFQQCVPAETSDRLWWLGRRTGNLVHIRALSRPLRKSSDAALQEFLQPL